MMRGIKNQFAFFYKGVILKILTNEKASRRIDFLRLKTL
jgi:hypothetical protein